jgi:hypothetical protein
LTALKYKRIKASLLIVLFFVAFQKASAQSPCDRISEIKILPFKGERVDDAAYNALLASGTSTIPCLISRITDTAKMPDPRQAPIYNDVRVGDVAYFMLIDIAKIDFVSMLPVRVQKAYESAGVYAYFEFVETSRNRVWLQRRLRDWSKSQLKFRSVVK